MILNNKDTNSGKVKSNLNHVKQSLGKNSLTSEADQGPMVRLSLTSQLALASMIFFI